MKSFRFMAVAVAAAALLGSPVAVHAGGSWGGSSGGGYASSGGGASSGGASSGGASSGGGQGFFSRLKARHASAGSSGGSSSGSSGGTYTASYASSGGSSGGVSAGSSGGSSGGSQVGPLRRLMQKIHARKAARRGGSSGGSSGGVTYASYSSGSSGGSSGGSASSGGNSSGGYASYSNYSAPVQSISLGATSAYESPIIESSYQSYTPMGETIIDGSYQIGETIIDGGSQSTESNSAGAATINDSTRYESAKPAIDADAAMLTVAVPENAVVTVNGHPTTSDGNVRQFMSRGLKDGFVYTYVVDVTYELEGVEKKDSKSIKLRPGDIEKVEFDIPVAQGSEASEEDLAAADKELVTVVKLHVPASAEVSLAGNATKGEGVVRTFRTKQLKAGEQWAGYTVRVTADIDGQTVSQERTVDVQAGSNIELTFDFADGAIASR